MILVIMGHVNFANHDIKAWVYSFHMPVFFFITGLVIKTRGKLLDDVRKFFSRLMIPYLLWAIIFASFSITNLSKIIYGSYSTISQSGALTSLWFLPVMFIAVVFLILTKRLLLIIKLDRKEMLLLISAISICIGIYLPKISFGYPWSLNVAFIAYSILIIGSMLRPILDVVHLKLERNKGIGISLSVFFSLLFFAGTMFYSYNIPEKGYVLMGDARYGNPYLFATTSFCGIFMLFSLCFILEFVCPKGIKFLSFVGQNTLCIFAVQKPIIHIMAVLFKLFHAPELIALLFATFFTLLLTCLISLAINKYAPKLVGKI